MEHEETFLDSADIFTSSLDISVNIYENNILCCFSPFPVSLLSLISDRNLLTNAIHILPYPRYCLRVLGQKMKTAVYISSSDF